MSVKSAGKARVGPELFRAAAELAHVADDDAHAAMRRSDDAADMDVLVAVTGKIAYLFAIGLQAHEGEMAPFVRKVGRADIEESGAV